MIFFTAYIKIGAQMNKKIYVSLKPKNQYQFFFLDQYLDMHRCKFLMKIQC